MKQFYANLKKAAEENPLAALAAVAALFAATAKLMDANTQRSYAQTHRREVDRRIAMSTK